MRLRNILPFLALAWLVASNWGWFRVQEDVLTPDQMADAGSPLRLDSSPSTDWVAAGDKFGQWPDGGRR